LREITPEQAWSLIAAEVTRYNHNLEASDNFYPEIVNSHSIIALNRLRTNIKEAGMQSCTRGILGMKETWEYQIDLAFSLRELGIESVSINLFNPKKRTPLGERSSLKLFDGLKPFLSFALPYPNKSYVMLEDENQLWAKYKV
jgi:biotin synthase